MFKEISKSPAAPNKLFFIVFFKYLPEQQEEPRLSYQEFLKQKIVLISHVE